MKYKHLISFWKVQWFPDHEVGIISFGNISEEFEIFQTNLSDKK